MSLELGVDLGPCLGLAQFALDRIVGGAQRGHADLGERGGRLDVDGNELTAPVGDAVVREERVVVEVVQHGGGLGVLVPC